MDDGIMEGLINIKSTLEILPPHLYVVDQGPVMARGANSGAPQPGRSKRPNSGSPLFAAFFLTQQRCSGPNNGPPLGIKVAVQIESQVAKHFVYLGCYWGSHWTGGSSK